MSEAASTSRVKNLVLTSPYFLLIFLFIPAVIIVSHLLHLPYKMNLLLVNNGCLLICVALRFIWYLSRMKRPDRYGADRNEPEGGRELAYPAAHVRSGLAGKGYRFDAAGMYGEKRDLGYLGTVVLYGGLLSVLLIGTYDNLYQYTGVVRLGIGDPKPLNNPESYGELIMGPAASPEQLPMLQVRRMVLPNAEWPRGAVEIGLWNKEGKMLAAGITAPGKSLRYNGFEYDMLKFSFVADFKAFTRDNQPEFDGVLTLLPLPMKKGVYTYYTPVNDPKFDKITGDAWFNPEKKALKVVLSREGKQILDTELELWGGDKRTQGNYTVFFPRLGQFTEIRVAHVRHFTMLKIGAVIALVGSLLRLLIRSQRVWLEEIHAGCRVKAAGAKTRKALDGLAGR
jgi:hypothetical protein